MSATLAAADKSRAVLIGASRFSNMPPLPSVKASVDALSTLMTDRSVWGLPPAHCTVVTDPQSPEQLIDAINAAAKEATDTLLIYYAGHGLIDPHDGALWLALTNSRPERLPGSATPYEWIRREILGGRARRRVVILDCCYSGRALGTMADPASAVADHAIVDGTYLLASAPDNRQALAPPDERYTAFTGELIKACGEGVPDGPELLDLDTVYRLVHDALYAKSRPLPQKRDRNTAGSLALFRNVAHRPAVSLPDPPAADPMSGRVPAGSASGPVPALFAGRYLLDHMIGTGGLSDVHLAREVDTGRQLSITVLRPDAAANERVVQRFRQGSGVASALHHPSIAAVLGFGEETVAGDRLPYLVTEYVDGHNLHDHLRGQSGPLTVQRAVDITRGILDALAYLYSRGVVHLDIKPGNVMLRPGGRVTLIDFGLMQWAGDAGRSAGDATNGRVLGTAQYMSPERVRGEPADSRADIYSTGCVLYQMLAGHEPFPGTSPVAVAYQHCREPPRPLSELYREYGWSPLPVAVDRAVLTALEKEPGKRFPTPADMLAALPAPRRLPPVPTLPNRAPAAALPLGHPQRWSTVHRGGTARPSTDLSPGSGAKPTKEYPLFREL